MSSNDHMDPLMLSPSSAFLQPQDQDLIRIAFQRPNDVVSITQANELFEYNSYPPMFGPKEDYSPIRAPFYTQDTLTPDLIQLFPSSTSLYIAMCEQFGSQNIAPLPQWLSDASDRTQKQWFKSGPNAFLYFLHKAPKHRARVRALANQSICCSCKPCVTTHMGNVYDMDPPTHYCRAWWSNELWFWLPILPLICTLCINCDCNVPEEHHLRYYGSHSSTRIKHPPAVGPTAATWLHADFCAASVCCQDHPTGPAALHHDMFRDINWALGDGSTTPTPSLFQSGWLSSCCGPCVDTQHHAIIDYLFYKRYGFAWGHGPAMNTIFSGDAAGQAAWSSHSTMYKAVPRTRDSSSPPSSYPHQLARTREAIPAEDHVFTWERRRYDVDDNDIGSVTETDRFRGPVPIYPLLLELTDLPRAVEYHNIIWKDLHKVVLPQSVLDVAALEMD